MGTDERVAVVHFTAPTCWWSWGYEPVFNRLKLVYGDQIRLLTFYGAVYEDVEEYKKHYELDDAGMVRWAKESQGIMGVPMHLNYRFDRMPKNLLPATLAVMAAERQGPERGHRFYRALLRRNIVEDQDVTNQAIMNEAAKEASLDHDKFLADRADEPGLKADLERQGEGAPHVHVGFYNIGVTDGRGRTVILDQQFQPSVAEGAIDYLTENQLKKTKPTNILSYLKNQGPSSLIEVQRVFNVSPDQAQDELQRLESSGEVKRLTLAGDSFWAT